MKKYLLNSGSQGIQSFVSLKEYNELPESKKPELVKGFSGKPIVLSSRMNGGRLVGDSDLREQGLEGSFIAIKS